MEQQKSLTTTDLQQRSSQGMQNDEAEIRKVIEGVNDAYRSGDINRLIPFYAEDVVAYDMPTPLSFKGINSYRRSWQMAMDMMKDFGSFETAEDKFFVNGDLGVYHGLCHMSGTLKKNNEKIDSWARYTGVFKKIGGRWKIVHEHFSVPLEMEQDKPAWNLKPEGSIVRH